MSDSDRLIAGKYRVVRLIASGGMGSVYEAVHVRTGGRVAIKILSDDAQKDESARSRFAREARASGRLRSRFVARVLDVDALENDTPYLVMEYLEGHDLAREIKQRGALPLEEVASIVLQTAAGVAEAHASGIVHRDLKPGNVFLAQEGAHRVAKVLDFGISKILVDADEELTRTFSTVGTPAYMSPEQIRTPKDVDSAADVWALGVLLYRLLAGHLPFTGNTSSVAVSICSDTPVPLGSVRSEVPTDVSALVASTLNKDRTQRPTISDLANTLVRHVSSGPEGELPRQAAAEIAALELITAQGSSSSSPLVPLVSGPTIEPLQESPVETATLAATTGGIDLREKTATPKRARRTRLALVGGVVVLAAIAGGVLVGRRPATVAATPAGTAASSVTPSTDATPAVAPAGAVATGPVSASVSIAPSGAPQAVPPTAANAVKPGGPTAKPKAVPTPHATAATLPARL